MSLRIELSNKKGIGQIFHYIQDSDIWIISFKDGRPQIESGYLNPRISALLGSREPQIRIWGIKEKDRRVFTVEAYNEERRLPLNAEGKLNLFSSAEGENPAELAIDNVYNYRLHVLSRQKVSPVKIRRSGRFRRRLKNT